MKKILWCCCFLLGFVALHAQTDALAFTDSSHVETGNPFKIYLSLKNGGEPRPSELAPWQQVLTPQNILESSRWQAHNTGEWRQTITVIFFDADTVQLPPLTLLKADGSAAQTNPLEIVITPTPAGSDLADMAEIKDIHREPKHWTDYKNWIIALLVFSFLLTAFFVWWAWKSRQRQATHTSALPPHERAMRAFAELENAQRWQRGDIKGYYAALTDILRQYLAARFRIPAPELSSYEIVRALNKQQIAPELLEQTEMLLREADLAKFAKSIPPDSWHSEALMLARNFVLQTRPEPPAQNSPSA
ncbi:MAG: hypothetical protein J0L99_20660 [Chitinophagales bacterium]|nr:hypothetical protein [Chitinophagales bacterium]